MGQDENTNPFNGNETPVFETPTPEPTPAEPVAETPAPAPETPAPIPVTTPGQVSESVSQLSSYNRLGMRPSRNLSVQEELDRISPKAPIPATPVAKEKAPRDPKIKIIIVLLIVTVLALGAMFLIPMLTGKGGGKKNSTTNSGSREDLATYVKLLQFGSDKKDVSEKMPLAETYVYKAIENEISESEKKEYAKKIVSAYEKYDNNTETDSILNMTKTVAEYIALDYDILEIDEKYRLDGAAAAKELTSNTVIEKDNDSMSYLVAKGIVDYKKEYIKILDVYQKNNCIVGGKYNEECIIAINNGYWLYPAYNDAQQSMVSLDTNIRSDVMILVEQIYNGAINRYSEGK